MMCHSSTDLFVYSSVAVESQNCLNDGNPLGLLIPFAGTWEDITQAECCFENFPLKFNHCMGVNSDDAAYLVPCSLPPTLSGAWYVQHTDPPSCVQECIGTAPCNGRAFHYEWLYSSFNECCEDHLSWIEGSSCPN